MISLSYFKGKKSFVSRRVMPSFGPPIQTLRDADVASYL
jgi:hypothetical protein